jgi:hypothetical protein
VVPPWPIPSPFRNQQWLFPIVVTVHNLEEAIWLPGFIAVHSNQIPWQVSKGEFRLALIVLTVAAWIVTYLSWRTGKQTVWAYRLRLAATGHCFFRFAIQFTSRIRGVLSSP